MAEYIEREKLSFHLASEMENCGEAGSSHRPIAYGSMLGLKTALSYVNTLPSADVVEVVRCKNCTYLRESDKTNRVFCTYHGDNYEFETMPDHYCSEGVAMVKGV